MVSPAGPWGRRAASTTVSLPMWRCVDCGALIAAVLRRLGSTRCHDCRK